MHIYQLAAAVIYEECIVLYIVTVMPMHYCRHNFSWQVNNITDKVCDHKMDKSNHSSHQGITVVIACGLIITIVDSITLLDLDLVGIRLCVVLYSNYNNWGEPERAPHDQFNGDSVCLSMYVHIPYIIYACSNSTMFNFPSCF